jgi:hypothetical protein
MDRDISKGRKITLGILYQDRATFNEVEGFIDISTTCGRDS